MLLAQPAVASTPFDTNMVQADTPLPACAQQRRIVGDVMAAAMKDGGDPAIVARVIVAAATGPKPRLRYAAGPAAGRVRTLRRVVPAPGLRQADPQAQPAGRRPAARTGRRRRRRRCRFFAPALSRRFPSFLSAASWER